MEAKIATQYANILFKKVPPSDLKRPIRTYVLKKWQERWSSPSLVNNKKYINIRSQIEPWSSSFHSSRRIEIILTRLRIGHTYMTHNFKLARSSEPICAHCNSVLSVEHILVHCTKFLNQRQKFFLVGKSVAEILGEEVDVDALVGYLHEIRIFNEI